jgi:hypothetical protein
VLGCSEVPDEIEQHAFGRCLGTRVGAARWPCAAGAHDAEQALGRCQGREVRGHRRCDGRADECGRDRFGRACGRWWRVGFGCGTGALFGARSIKLTEREDVGLCSLRGEDLLGGTWLALGRLRREAGGKTQQQCMCCRLLRNQNACRNTDRELIGEMQSQRQTQHERDQSDRRSLRLCANHSEELAVWTLASQRYTRNVRRFSSPHSITGAMTGDSNLSRLAAAHQKDRRCLDSRRSLRIGRVTGRWR